MIGLMQDIPKVLISEKRISSICENKQNGEINEKMKQIINNDIYLAVSKYSDCFMIIINQTNTMGSIYKGKLLGQVLPQIDQEQFDYQNQDNMYENGQNMMKEIEKDKKMTTEKLYQVKCLFGSTEIEFYELLVRKIVEVLFEQHKTDGSISVIVNVSLPVKWKEWTDYEHRYYQEIIKCIKQSLKEII